ncbi:MAG: thiamine-phosphate kinase [Gemmatimonadetes bacterium]|nr:thiamine-phosphate kinase [Gemmatimonadota bacterium]
MSGAFDAALGEGPEFDRIRRLAARWRERAHGLGDDCAFLEAGGETLAVSVDLAVEGVHFRREWLTPAEIGYRAAAAALSDLAAVAAEPMALLLSLGLPVGEDEATVQALADGVGDAAADAGAVIVGGDLSRADQLVVGCCVIGRAPSAVRRVGARPGDRLVVTGALGGPLTALTAWEAGEEPDAEARVRFARPAPRHVAARFLAAHRARAMIDLSDGLAGDVGHLLAASAVGAALWVERIPVLHAAASCAARLGEPPWRFAARSGEEYELLAALPSDVADAELAQAPVPVAVIGVVEAEPGVRASDAGRAVVLPPGYDHFRPA